jgi:regulator of sigma E protease
MELVALIYKFGLYKLGYALYYFLTFSLIISVIVFVHEFGHYIVAKICKVKIESFSIGFGPEIFGFNDKSGTRWRISIIPLGGYVKMLGDMNAASVPSSQQSLTDEKKLYAFTSKPCYQKAAIAFAGPFANILFSLVVYIMVFSIWGYHYVPPIIQSVVKDSPAEKAGLLPGDTITKVHGYRVKCFEDIQRMMMLYIDKKNVEIEYVRDNKVTIIHLKTQNKVIAGKTPSIGIVSAMVELKNPSFLESIGKAVNKIYNVVYVSISAMIRMITREHGTGGIGGPVSVAIGSVQCVKRGLSVTLQFIAFVSIELAIMNLLPIPLLDGGHLFQYIVEIIIRRELGLRYQKYAVILGAFILLLIMAIALWNDLKYLILSI